MSVEEYARIQQFPDSWHFEGNIQSVYKQIGNAVPVGLGYAIGRQIMKNIEGKTDYREEAANKIPYSRYTNAMDTELQLMFGEETGANN